MKGRPALTALVIGSLLLGSWISPMPATAADGDKMLRHIVLYKFKDSLPAAQLQEVIDAFAGLPKKIDTIVGYEAGTNVSPEGKSEGFTHVFVVTFKSAVTVSPGR